MSQKVSPILFNSVIFNQSKWFNKNINKFALNEDLQIREIINILFKHNISYQFFFIDKIIIYKYNNKIKIYLYFFCNFRYLKKNLLLKTKQKKNFYIKNYYLYFKYTEFLNIKKIEIIKILRALIFKNTSIYLYLKNINYIYNSDKFLSSTTKLRKSKAKYVFKYFKNTSDLIKKITEKKQIKHKYDNNFVYTKFNYSKNKLYIFKKQYFKRLKYFKTIHFILYLLCYQNKILLPLHISSLLSVIHYELDNLENSLKNYNFLFYSIFNLIRECLEFYMSDKNCLVTGIRIQVKGRYFITKRKRIFILNLGKLNLNKINLKKDYSSINLIKTTGASSIKIWINYK